MQQWYGETEDSYYRTSPEQDPYISYISYFGEVCVFFHSEEGLAVTHQLFQMFQGHAASLSYSRGGHCATLLRTMNGERCMDGEIIGQGLHIGLRPGSETK